MHCEIIGRCAFLRILEYRLWSKTHISQRDAQIFLWLQMQNRNHDNYLSVCWYIALVSAFVLFMPISFSCQISIIETHIVTEKRRHQTRAIHNTNNSCNITKAFVFKRLQTRFQLLQHGHPNNAQWWVSKLKRASPTFSSILSVKIQAILCVLSIWKSYLWCCYELFWLHVQKQSGTKWESLFPTA